MATFFKNIRNTIKHWYVPAIIGALFIVLAFISLPFSNLLTFHWPYFLAYLF